MLGCDLSGEMVARAAARCADAGGRARFVRASVGDAAGEITAGRLPAVDGAISRLVLHHAPDPAAFLAEQLSVLRPGAVLVLADHLGDADRDLADWHRRLEVMRDRTHTTNLSGGGLVDLMARSGLTGLRYEEHPISTTFDEWFDRGTPSVSKDECRAWLLRPIGRRSRAWRGTPLPDGGIRLDGIVAFVRGVANGGR